MTIIWDNYYSQANHISDPEAATCIAVMRQTAVVHATQDFPGGFNPNKLALKVNYPANQHNWINIRMGHDDRFATHNEVVIIYHLLSHRLRDSHGDPNYGFWTHSVGFRQRLLSTTNGSEDPNNAHPYEDFGLQIIRQLHIDLHNLTPSGDVSVIYDDVDPDEPDPDPTHPQGHNQLKRRSTKIGELGWFCQHNNAVSRYFDVGIPIRRPHPINGSGAPIKGWGRFNSDTGQAEDIVVTKLVRR